MDTVLFFAVVLAASILQTSTGFGFSIVATPFLLMMFEPGEAIQINLLLSLVISGALFTRILKDMDFSILKRFIAGSVVGMPVGILTFMFIDIRQLKLGISLVILLLTVMLTLKFRVKQNHRHDLIVGGISGSLTTSIGMPGPPLLLYFSGTGTQKEKLRGTTLAFYLFIYSVSLVIQIIFAGTSTTVWISSGVALPLVFLGLYLGQVMFKWISPKIFRLFTYIILLFTGGYMLMESLGLW